MLVEGEGLPQNDLDSFCGTFANWVELFQLAKAFDMGYLIQCFLERVSRNKGGLDLVCLNMRS